MIVLDRNKIVNYKLVYVGTSVLDLGKLCLMDFNY